MENTPFIEFRYERVGFVIRSGRRYLEPGTRPLSTSSRRLIAAIFILLGGVKGHAESGVPDEERVNG